MPGEENLRNPVLSKNRFQRPVIPDRTRSEMNQALQPGGMVTDPVLHLLGGSVEAGELKHHYRVFKFGSTVDDSTDHVEPELRFLLREFGKTARNDHPDHRKRWTELPPQVVCDEDAALSLRRL